MPKYTYLITMPTRIVPNSDPGSICFEFNDQKHLDAFISEKPALKIISKHIIVQQQKLQITVNIKDHLDQSILNELSALNKLYAETNKQTELVLAYVIIILRGKKLQEVLKQDQLQSFLTKVSDDRELKQIIDGYEHPFSSCQYAWDNAINLYRKQRKPDSTAIGVFENCLPEKKLESWINQNLKLVTEEKNNGHEAKKSNYKFVAFTALSKMRHMLRPMRRNEVATAVIGALPADKFYLAMQWEEALSQDHYNSLSTWLFDSIRNRTNINLNDVIKTLIKLNPELLWRKTVEIIVSMLENKPVALKNSAGAPALSSSPANHDSKDNHASSLEYAEELFNTVLVVVGEHVSSKTREQFAEYILMFLKDPTTCNNVTGMLSPKIIVDGELLGKALLKCLKEIHLITNQRAIFDALNEFKAIIPQNLQIDIAAELFKLTDVVADNEKAKTTDSKPTETDSKLKISAYSAFFSTYANFYELFSDNQNALILPYIGEIFIILLQNENLDSDVLIDLKVCAVKLPKLINYELFIEILNSNHIEQMLLCLFAVRNEIHYECSLWIQQFIQTNTDEKGEAKLVHTAELLHFNRIFTLLGNQIIPELSLKKRAQLLAIAERNDTQTSRNLADQKSHKSGYHQQWQWRINLCDPAQPNQSLATIPLDQWVKGTFEIPDDKDLEYDTDRHSFFMFVLFIKNNKNLLNELNESPQLHERIIIRAINHFIRWAHFYIDIPDQSSLSILPREYREVFNFLESLVTKEMHLNIINAIGSYDPITRLSTFCQCFLYGWIMSVIGHTERNQILDTAIMVLNNTKKIDKKHSPEESTLLLIPENEQIYNLNLIIVTGIQQISKPRLRVILQILVTHLISQATRNKSTNAYRILKDFIIPFLNDSERMYLLLDLLIPKFDDPNFSNSEKFISILSLTHYTLARDFMISAELRVPDVKTIVVDYLEDTNYRPKFRM